MQVQMEGIKINFKKKAKIKTSPNITKKIT